MKYFLFVTVEYRIKFSRCLLTNRRREEGVGGPNSDSTCRCGHAIFSERVPSKRSTAASHSCRTSRQVLAVPVVNVRIARQSVTWKGVHGGSCIDGRPVTGHCRVPGIRPGMGGCTEGRRQGSCFLSMGHVVMRGGHSVISKGMMMG